MKPKPTIWLENKPSKHANGDGHQSLSASWYVRWERIPSNDMNSIWHRKHSCTGTLCEGYCDDMHKKRDLLIWNHPTWYVDPSIRQCNNQYNNQAAKPSMNIWWSRFKPSRKSHNYHDRLHNDRSIRKKDRTTRKKGLIPSMVVNATKFSNYKSTKQLSYNGYSYYYNKGSSAKFCREPSDWSAEF